MRRSSREPKKPEFLTFSNLGQVTDSQQSSQTARDEDSDDAERSESEEEVEEEEEEEEEEEIQFEDTIKPAASARKGRSKAAADAPKATKRAAAAKRSTARATLAGKGAGQGAEPRLDETASLFDRISTQSKFETDAEEWIDHYRRERVSAIVELVNTALIAAGAKENCLEDDVDLDALDHEEIETLLTNPIKKMTQTEGSKLYPLVAKGKGKQTFRKKYQMFWQTLCRSIYTARSSGFKANQALQRIVEQFATLSSMAVVNIRDAVLEASLSIADTLSEICLELKQRREVAERQLSSSSKSKRVADEKTKALTKQRDETTKELTSFSEVLQTIFTAVYLHRSKDYQEELRLHTLRHLPAFLAYDLSLPLKTENLKYLGWACYDSSAHVRQEAMQIIQDLVKNDELVAHLQHFVDHFIERIICMAAGDDASVSLLTLQTLRVMQTQGLLDSISEEQLDLVDAVVFNAEAAERVRAEALLFLMDHTQGFDDLDEEALRADLRKKSKSVAVKRIDEAVALEQQRNRALQLETLTEFAEHHLQDRSEGAVLLAEALLATEKADLLFDWSTIVSLLTRENEELITSALRPTQVSILLRMLATSAHTVSRTLSQRENDRDGQGESAKEREITRLWRDRFESLSLELQSQLAKLLVRFRDSDRDLAVLSELLAVCPKESLSAGLFQSLQQLLLAPQQHSDALTRNVALALRRSLTLSDTLSQCVQALWKQCVTHAQSIAMLLQRESEKKQRGRRSSGGERAALTAVQREIEEDAALLARALRKFQILWETLDCRPFLLQSESESAEEDETQRVSDLLSLSLDVLEITRAAPALCSLSLSLSASSTLSSSLCDSLSQLVRNVLGTAKTLLLWSYRDVVHAGRAFAALQEEDSEEKTAAERDFVAKLELVREMKDAFVETCMLCLRGEREAESEGETDSVFSLDAELTRRVRVGAFVAVNDVRTLLPQRLDREFSLAVPISLSPDVEMLRALKSVFDEETQRLRERMDALDRESERELLREREKEERRGRRESAKDRSVQAQKELEQREQERSRERDELCRELANTLLFPLSGSLVYDVESLNRKQMAAVLVYLFDERESVQEAAKSIARALREKDLLKFLQVQLLLLKDAYLESVLESESGAHGKEENEDEDAQRARQQGVERVQAVARKLSGLVGVGKLRTEAAHFVRDFLIAGADHALLSPANCDFFHALSAYLRFLTPTLKNEVGERIQAILAARETDTESQEAQELCNNEALQHFVRTLSPTLASSLLPSVSRSAIGSKRISGAARERTSSTRKRSRASPKKKEKERESEIAPTSQRRSSRSRARQSVSYAEAASDDEAIEEFSDEDIEREIAALSASSQRGGSQPSSQRRAGSQRSSEEPKWATGLDIDDLSEDDDITRILSGNRMSSLSSSSYAPKKRSLDLQSSADANKSSRRR